MSVNYVLADYIWLDAWQRARSKTKVIHGVTSVTLADLGDWNFDGSSTGQAPGTDSEVIIKPRALYPDPFRGGNHVMVLCDTYTPKGEAIPTNTRHIADTVFKQGVKEEPWFGIEQEYVLFRKGAPLGWPTDALPNSQLGSLATLGYPGPQGPYYCSAGADVAFGRDIVEEHLLMCTKANLKISGTNAEVMPGQWEFQVGPCLGIEAGDMHTMARFLLARVCEKYNVTVSYEPKPILGDWNGSGCHTNFSTKDMREKDNALDKCIIPAIERLGKRHQEHIYCYGSGNEKRLTGKHETASMKTFSYGIASRKSSVRIGNETALKKKGYFEDRRPAANMDPYLVTSMIFDTCCLGAKHAKLFPSPATSKKAGALGSPRGKHAGSFNGSESEDTGSEGSEGFRSGTPRKSDLKKKGKNGNGCASIM